MSPDPQFPAALVAFVRAQFGTNDFIPLHAPRFDARDVEYVREAVESGFVSTVGKHVAQFEQAVRAYTGAGHAIATVNGTSALHAALLVAGVQAGEEVITQSITFVATCNAIRYCGGEPVFVDIERTTLGMAPDSLQAFLEAHAERRDDGLCWNRTTGRVIRACVPMHNGGHPVRIDRIAAICREWGLELAVFTLTACFDMEARKQRHFERGVELFEAGDDVRARLEFRNVLQIDDRHAPVVLAGQGGGARGRFPPGLRQLQPGGRTGRVPWCPRGCAAGRSTCWAGRWMRRSGTARRRWPRAGGSGCIDASGRGAFPQRQPGGGRGRRAYRVASQAGACGGVGPDGGESDAAGGPARAIALLERAIEANPDAPELRLILGGHLDSER
jgi:hypothetical protein